MLPFASAIVSRSSSPLSRTVLAPVYPIYKKKHSSGDLESIL
ncbi:Hypothetical protein RY67_2012 [Bifidobacterium longum subsp. infantis]|uniref:Uncharacterized protein n=1 Tax=Bifidobacterium longum subsp. infantis TaxID=1682 RepID=A0A0M4MFY4_BIFLI|nr:Hypothetical protein RY67_2012 [Bifidobacterium longum subsp. infantis]